MPGSDFYTYELKGWAGLDTRPNIADKPPNMVEDCQNIDFEQGGVIAKRRGTRNMFSGSTGSRVNLIYDFQSQQGFSTLSDKHRTLIVRGTVLQIYNGNTMSQTMAASNAIHYAVSSDNGACYIANENGNDVRLLYYSTVSSTFALDNLLLSRPPQNAGTGIGFNSLGAYTGGSWKYLYTYVDIFGNESQPAALQSTVSSLTLSQTYGVYFDRQGITPSTELSVTYIKIYTCHVGVTADYHFVGTASNISYTASNTFQLPYDDSILALGAVLAGVSAYSTLQASTISVTVTNPGAETGDITGWTGYVSSLSSSTQSWALYPHSGSYFFVSENGGGSEDRHGMRQDITIDSSLYSVIDLGQCSLNFKAYGHQGDSRENRKIYTSVILWDGIGEPSAFHPLNQVSGNSVYNSYVTGVLGWNEITCSMNIPPGSRKIRVFFECYDAGFGVDDVSITINAPILQDNTAALDAIDARGKYLAIYNNNLVIAGNPVTSDLLTISNPVFHRQFDVNDFVRVMSNDAQPVIGLRKYSDNLVVGKTKSIFSGYGQISESFNVKELDTDHGALGQGCMVSAQRRYIIFTDNGIFAGYGGNIFDEISEPIRSLIRSLNKSSLNSLPTKAFACDFTWAQKILFAVREATGAGENDAIIVWDYSGNGSWSKYKGIPACYLAQVTDSDGAKYLYGGESNGYCFLFTHDGMATIENNDNHSGTISAISSYFETPWINLPRAAGIQWARALTESVWMQIWAGGEPASGTHITLQTNVYTDYDEATIKGTFSTTHHAEAYPAVTCDPKTIENFAGDSVVFENIKLRITNNTLGEHYKVHKLVFGFRVRPSLEK
jgi:hypothetical protein